MMFSFPSVDGARVRSVACGACAAPARSDAIPHTSRTVRRIVVNLRISKSLEASVRVAEAIERDFHAIRNRQIQAAQLALLVASVKILERASGFERAAETAGGDHRQLHVIVLPPRPHVRQ